MRPPLPLTTLPRAAAFPPSCLYTYTGVYPLEHASTNASPALPPPVLPFCTFRLLLSLSLLRLASPPPSRPPRMTLAPATRRHSHSSQWGARLPAGETQDRGVQQGESRACMCICRAAPVLGAGRAQPLMTAMGRSLTAILEMPEAWHVPTTASTSCGQESRAAGSSVRPQPTECRRARHVHAALAASRPTQPVPAPAPVPCRTRAPPLRPGA